MEIQNGIFHYGLSIYYVIQDGREGHSQLITILHGGRGGLPNLLKYYIGGFFKAYYNITDLIGIWNGFLSITYIFM